MEEQRRQAGAVAMQYQHADASSIPEFDGLPKELPEDVQQEAQQGTYVREHPKVGRNEPCPCGSGLKYKKCHGLK